MKQFRLFFSIFFLLASLVIILLVFIFDIQLFSKVIEIIKNYVWIAVIAALLFLILLTTGIVSNLDSIKRSLINNGYFQLAILELFICSAGLAYIWYIHQRPGQLVFRIHPDTTKNYVYLEVQYEGSDFTMTDTVRAPGKLLKKPAGNYIIKTIDQDVVEFKTEVMLEPATIETVLIPVKVKTKTLAIQTEPPGADIWINGVQATKAPDTFEILLGDTVTIDLKLSGYQVYSDTISLHEDIDLGTISLKKLYTVWISSRYADVSYSIYDEDRKVVFSSYGSRKTELPQGTYRLTYEIGEGQYETKIFSVNYNLTVMIP